MSAKGWRLAWLVLVGLPVVSCSDGEPTRPRVQAGGVGIQVVEPATLKFKVNGNWQSLRQVGDYIKKLVGDSFEVRAGGYAAVKYPKAAIGLDATGGTRIVDSASVRHIRIERKLPFGTYVYVRQVGDIYRILGNEGSFWQVEINNQWYTTPTFKNDALGDARYEKCETAPFCGSNRPYDAYIWRITTSHPGTWGTAFRLDTLGDRIVGARADNVGPEWCGTGTGPGWQVAESGENLGPREPDWAWSPGVPGSFPDAYYANSVFTGGSFLATCWKNVAHDVATTHKHDSIGPRPG